MKIAKDMTFVDAYNRLKEISQLVANDDMVDVDNMEVLQEEAKMLYDFCHTRLVAFEEKALEKEEVVV